MKSLIYTMLKPYSAILFLQSRMIGFLLLLLTFINPSVALSGIVAIAFALLFAYLLGIKEDFLSQGFYIYNSLLVGMGVGYLYEPTLLSFSLVAIVSSLTFLLSFMINRLFSVYQIPILSLPFAIVTMFLYLASLKYSALLSSLVNSASMSDITLPLILSGFFKSLGTIFFLPNNIAGILMILLVLYVSRVVFIMALSGYYFGVLVHSFLLGSYEQALQDPYAFNYILVAIALGGIFLLPTIKGFFIAMIGVAMSVVMTDAIGMLFHYYGIPVFTLPFNLTVILFIFTLSAIYYKEFNYNIKATPEESLSAYLSGIFRFGEIATKISLPFSGNWSVYQGFEGEWTHKGFYKYAYDFVVKYDTKSYQNEGLELKDYYAFGESILSPVSGYIVDSRADLPDNYIGEVDRVNNWGNYIIIKSDLGFFVEISHIMQHSIHVKIGEYVQVGKPIAKCGNSGYSPEPHLHIQVQDGATLGAFTREFCFSECYLENELLFNHQPKKRDVVGGVITDKNIYSRLLFILDDSFKYDVYEESVKIAEVEFVVKMSENGEFYFQDDKENRLYFYTDIKQFYFYNYEGVESHLKHLFRLVPRVPFVNQKDTLFQDSLPLYLLQSRVKKMVMELLSIFNKDIYRMDMMYRFDKMQIRSSDGVVEIESSDKGFALIAYSNKELRRVL